MCATPTYIILSLCCEYAFFQKNNLIGISENHSMALTGRFETVIFFQAPYMNRPLKGHYMKRLPQAMPLE